MSERGNIEKGQQEKEEPFYAGQTRVLEMVAANVPLPEILTNLVLLMEAQAERCRRLREQPEIIQAHTHFHWWPEITIP